MQALRFQGGGGYQPFGSSYDSPLSATVPMPTVVDMMTPVILLEGRVVP